VYLAKDQQISRVQRLAVEIVATIETTTTTTTTVEIRRMGRRGKSPQRKKDCENIVFAIPLLSLVKYL
jgi:hypothetical protein